MGVTIEYLKLIRRLQKLQKHMKKNNELKKYFDNWLEKKFKTNDTKTVMKILQTDQSALFEMVNEYDDIKNKYK
jgi:hypothetical protein